ncbi:ABC transporter substrate-binding protein [Marinomonas balearica]|uniref:Putative ABC transport system substrate-binding protein n=1 Tax=Marinomonas balearica TaxID=491947 RepID=A0A4R6M9B8_9GAMM|nr:ABC transporter substrate-binding protein [Marinomonas balearica]TDO98023.1 putative ABC transport system substrate-binding protein [Marinomonas balearica]
MKFIGVMFTLMLVLVSNAFAAENGDNKKTVFMTVWRGCEEACQGFHDYLKGQPVDIIVRNANRDRSKLAGFLEEAKTLSPDLVVTWGTSVSKAIIGTRKEYGTATKLGDIPVMFMIVADPLGADIIESHNTSGRPTVAGIRNRVGEDVQIKAMREYFPVDKVGVLYSSGELNSVLNTQKLEALSKEMNFEVVTQVYDLDESGKPLPNQFDAKMAQLAERGADVIYVGSSSYNQTNSDEFTKAAIKYGLPVASAYDSMVTGSSALISVSNKYYLVGQLAANQAGKILFDGAVPGELPIAELSSYSMSINMAVARQMSLYPPIQLLRFADLVNIDGKDASK